MTIERRFFMGKKLWYYGKKLWNFDLLWKNNGIVEKTMVLYQKLLYSSKL